MVILSSSPDGERRKKMRSKSGKKMKVAVSSLVAAAFGYWVGMPTAHAGFVISFANNGNPVQSVNGYSDYVIQALNDGSASTPSNYTGTSLAALDVTISTSGGADLGIEVINDGHSLYTPDVDGTYDTNAVFGQVQYGTFIGIGDDILANSAFTEGGTSGVYTNGQT